jgi:hypothetical protein
VRDSVPIMQEASEPASLTSEEAVPEESNAGSIGD